MNEIILFDKLCLFIKDKNETIIYGQYKKKFINYHFDINNYNLVFCNDRSDFYIKISGLINNIQNAVFYFENNNKIEFNNIQLCFPFENCDLILDKNKSAIISTICKGYSHRLDEWIQYNLQLGFSGIVIFNNDKNISNELNESIDNCIIKYSTEDICKKYKGKIHIVDCDYAPLYDDHWNNIQRITLHIGVNAFKNKCRNIALIDADEFIYISSNPSMKIEDFLQNHETITMKSNILTNKNNDDIINNNILQIAEYLGEDKYSKTILFTNQIKENEFIITPHNHLSERIMNKDQILHYHCWVNKRYEYKDSMKQIKFLQSRI
jgi:hypothetical protein